MELSFIFSAVRRYFLVIQLGIVAGLVLALMFAGSRAEVFTAQASLLVQPPESALARVDNNASERFLRSQLILLGSSQLAEDVAARLEGEDSRSVRSAISVEQSAGTDVVIIGATTADPARAQLIANTYVAALLDDQERRAVGRNSTEIGIVDERIEAIDSELSDLRTIIAQIPDPPVTTADRVANSQALGSINQLEIEFTSLLNTRSNLQLTSNLTVQTEVIELAGLPINPDGQSSQLLAIAGAFVGGALGLAVAVSLASASKKVIDATQLEELLGANVATKVPWSMRLRDHENAFNEIPDSAAAAIDTLCVQAEAAGIGRPTVRIAVVGTQASAGVTTTALAMAHRFSLQGSRVLVVDADNSDADLSELFGQPGHSGLADLVDQQHAYGSFVANGNGADGMSARVSELEPYLTATSDSRVDVLGAGTGTGTAVLQRNNVDNIIDTVSSSAVDMVIFDCGALQQSAATVRVAELADVVVLAVPLKRQRVEPITLVRRLLTDVRGTILPVVTEPRRRKRKSKRSTS